LSFVSSGTHSAVVVPGTTLFDCADTLKVKLASSCLRTGQCHECIVTVSNGETALSSRSDPEAFLSDNFRLACQAIIVSTDSDVTFSPLNRRPRILESKTLDHRPLLLEPVVRRVGNQVLYGDSVIDRYRGGCFGITVDLGTTTAAIDLIDLEDGATRATVSFETPQGFGGSDVMARISYDSREVNTGELQKAAVSGINRAIQETCTKAGISPPLIYEIAVVGNTTMRDILFGIDVQSVGQRPYKSLVECEYRDGRRDSTALIALSRSIGIRANHQARLYGLPLIASHVGADAAAGILAVDLDHESKTCMLVDIGTNTEVLLRHDDQLFAASCPAGPAFEGGLVTHGMRAYEGAIESTKISDQGLLYDYSVIGGGRPEGLCGSGLVDLLAELRGHDLINEKSVFVDDPRRDDLMILPDRGITFSKEDASNLAQAKAANYSGQVILMRAAGIAPSDIDTLYLAGGFANFINVENAMKIGLLPTIELGRVVKVGNAALDGARSALMSLATRTRLEKLADEVMHVELETMPEFFEIFVEGCLLKPMPTDLSSFDR